MVDPNIQKQCEKRRKYVGNRVKNLVGDAVKQKLYQSKLLGFAETAAWLLPPQLGSEPIYPGAISFQTEINQNKGTFLYVYKNN